MLVTSVDRLLLSCLCIYLRSSVGFCNKLILAAVASDREAASLLILGKKMSDSLEIKTDSMDWIDASLLLCISPAHIPHVDLNFEPVQQESLYFWWCTFLKQAIGPLNSIVISYSSKWLHKSFQH